MTPMYYKGYFTSCTGPKGENRFVICKEDLKAGKKYLCERCEWWSESNGNGGSTWSSKETGFNVFHPRTKRLIKERVHWSRFVDSSKQCNEHNLAFINEKSNIQMCLNCFQKFKKIEKLVKLK